MQSKATISAVKLALLSKKMNMADWARQHGFNYNATIKILHRYVEKQQVPQSSSVYDVLVALEKDTGINLMGENNG